MKLDSAYQHNSNVSDIAFSKIQKAWKSGARREALGILVDEILTKANESYVPSKRNLGTWSEEERDVLRAAFSIHGKDTQAAYAYAAERLLRDGSQIRAMSGNMKLRYRGW